MRGQYIRKMKCLYDNKGKCRRDLWVETAAAEAAEREVLHPEAVPLLEEALLQEAVLQEAVGSAEGERHVYLPAAVLHRGAAVRLQETAVLHRGNRSSSGNSSRSSSGGSGRSEAGSSRISSGSSTASGSSSRSSSGFSSGNTSSYGRESRKWGGAPAARPVSL